MQLTTKDRIAALLSETGAAHGEYEERVLGGAYDENWPAWYAEHLVHRGIGEVLDGGSAPTVERLSGLLEQLDEEYRRERPAASWPVYYAGRLVAALG